MQMSSPSKLCFVVSPIGDEDSDIRVHADWVLEEIVEHVMAEFPDFAVERADKLPAPGMIDRQVIDRLLSAELVIADLSLLNPNAFYEIGIRHMTQKPIIHMHQASEKIPFDVRSYRSIKFARRTPADLRKARADLKSGVEAVLAQGYQVQNPVTDANERKGQEVSAAEAVTLIREFSRHRRIEIGEIAPGEISWSGTKS